MFHRPELAVLLVGIVAIHWILPSRLRNALLLAVSWGLYALWDWRFLTLLWWSTAISYACGQAIARSESTGRRQIFLGLSLVNGIGLLFIFKYLNFFTDSLASLASGLGMAVDVPTLYLIIPLGISFYTFQTLSYTIDIYRKRLEPVSNPLDFALFVAFFPQLVMGPIEKARDLLPQLQAPRRWADVRVREGLFLFAQGWMLKVILADPAGRLVDGVFAMEAPSGATLWVALYAFTLQLYGDFAGYSRMARGIACLLGVELSVNFNLPFFSVGYVDFFKRWHITLSSWIGEYVYQPMYYGLLRTQLFRSVKRTSLRMWLSTIITVFVTRMLFAVWHGASMNFVGLGLFIFSAQMVSVALRPLAHRVPKWPGVQGLMWVGRTLVTVHLFAIAMLFFRSHDWANLSTHFVQLFGGLGTLDPGVMDTLPYLACAVALLVAHEIAQFRSGEFWLNRQSFYVNITYYMALVFLFRAGTGIDDIRFIYFQF